MVFTALSLDKKLIAIFVILMAVLLLFTLVRAVKGPRFTDRVVAVNVIGTMATAILAAVSVILDEDFLADVAIVYALLNFLSVVVLCRVVILHNIRRENHLKEEKKNDN